MKYRRELNEIKKNIGFSRTSKALTELKEYIDKNKIEHLFANLLLNLLSRYANLDNEKMSNTISRDEYNKELSKINNDLLSLIDKVAETEKQYDVFLCFNSEDMNYVRTVFNYLEDKDLNVCFSNSENEINKGLYSSELYLVFFKNQSIFFQNSIVEDYIKIISRDSTKIVNVLLPHSNKRIIPDFLTNYEYFDFYDLYDEVIVSSFINKLFGNIVPIYKDSVNHLLKKHSNPKGFEANIPQIVKLLIGQSLYKRNDVFIRELIQNAFDATERIKGKINTRIPEIIIRINSKEHYFEVDDNGEGMNSKLLRESFAIIGKSINTIKEVQFIDAESRRNVIGQFGIGFISAFMVANRICVSTTYEGDDQINFEIYNVEETFIYPSDNTTNRASKKNGTTIRLYLKNSVHDLDLVSVTKEYCRLIKNISLYNDDTLIELEDNWILKENLCSLSSTIPEICEIKLAVFEKNSELNCSNYGFYVCKDPETILSKYTPRFVGGEINFLPSAIDLTVARNDFVINDKSKIIETLIFKQIRRLLVKAIQLNNLKINNLIFPTLLFYAQNNKTSCFESLEEVLELLLNIWHVNYMNKEMCLRDILNVLRQKNINRIYTRTSDTILLHYLNPELEILEIDTRGDVRFYTKYDYHHVNQYKVLEMICKHTGFEINKIENPIKSDIKSIIVNKSSLSKQFILAIDELSFENKIEIELISKANSLPVLIKKNREYETTIKNIGVTKDIIINCEDRNINLLCNQNSKYTKTEIKLYISGLLVRTPATINIFNTVDLKNEDLSLRNHLFTDDAEFISVLNKYKNNDTIFQNIINVALENAQQKKMTAFHKLQLNKGGEQLLNEPISYIEYIDIYEQSVKDKIKRIKDNNVSLQNEINNKTNYNTILQNKLHNQRVRSLIIGLILLGLAIIGWIL